MIVFRFIEFYISHISDHPELLSCPWALSSPRTHLSRASFFSSLPGRGAIRQREATLRLWGWSEAQKWRILHVMTADLISAAAHSALSVMCDVSSFVARAGIKGTEEVSQLQPPGNRAGAGDIWREHWSLQCHRILASHWSGSDNAGLWLVETSLVSSLITCDHNTYSQAGSGKCIWASEDSLKWRLSFWIPKIQ